MNVYEVLLGRVLEEEHRAVGVEADFNIFEVGPSFYEISIRLKTRGWSNQEKSIDAMINVRRKLLPVMRINYYYFN